MRVWRATNKKSGEMRECPSLAGLFDSLTRSMLFYECDNYPNWTFKSYIIKEENTL